MFSWTRGKNEVLCPHPDFSLTDCAFARLRPCCSNLCAPNSSARMSGSAARLRYQGLSGRKGLVWKAGQGRYSPHLQTVVTRPRSTVAITAAVTMRGKMNAWTDSSATCTPNRRLRVLAQRSMCDARAAMSLDTKSGAVVTGPVETGAGFSRVADMKVLRRLEGSTEALAVVSHAIAPKTILRANP